ncbi:MFS transporter [Paracoccus contaminans]|nr:MFS transporter [Paracoccus contaminans]
MARHRIAAYMATSMFIALTQGLAQGWTSAVLGQIAGQIGATTTQASWLVVAFMIPKTALPILLIKIRTQYGLRRFTEIGILAHVLVTILSLFSQDLRSAITVQVLAGITSAPLSTLAFLYMLEGLSPQMKMRLGLPLVLTFIMVGSPLARALAPLLMGDGDWQVLHLVSLGMALASLALVFLLPLNPMPRQNVIAPLDLVSFVLIAIGVGGLTAAFTQGPTYWWTEASWTGILMACAVAALAAAAAIELNRSAPLIDIRWLLTAPVLHLTGALLLFRLLLSEQAAGAPRMFQALGLSPDQMVPLFAAIVAASMLGGMACSLVIKPGRESQIHLAALLLIAAGAYLDSHSTIDTRPAQLIASQSLIAFAGALFLPPAMMAGLLQALSKGPNYILSFIIVFLTTQAIGGTLGSGIFTTFINTRQAYHLHALSDQLSQTSWTVQAAIGQRVQALAASIPDSAARRAQAVSQIAQEASQQAYVLAYNDAFLATFLGACGAIALLLLHWTRDHLAGSAAVKPVPPPASSS